MLLGGQLSDLADLAAGRQHIRPDPLQLGLGVAMLFVLVVLAATSHRWLEAEQRALEDGSREGAERAVERAAVRAAGVMAAAARVAAVMVEVVPLWSKTAGRDVAVQVLPSWTVKTDLVLPSNCSRRLITESDTEIRFPGMYPHPKRSAKRPRLRVYEPMN